MGELVKEIQNVTQEVLENKKGSWKDQLSFLCVCFLLFCFCKFHCAYF